MNVSIEQIITRAKLRLRLENTLHDSYIEKLINEGASHMGSVDAYRVACAEVDIDCFRADLPPFFEEFIAGRFPSGSCSCGCNQAAGVTITNGQPVPSTLNALEGTGCGCPVWYVNPGALTNFAGGGGSRASYGNYFDIDIAQRIIAFPSTITATSFKLWYRSYNVDGNGLMIINEFWERGLSAYAASQFALDYPERYLPEQRRNWHAEWVAQLMKCRAKANTDRFRLDKGAIQNIMNSIMINKWVIGQYNVQGYI